MQSVTCLFPRKQPQTPQRLSKVSGGEGWGRGLSSEQFALIAESRPAESLQRENLSELNVKKNTQTNKQKKRCCRNTSHVSAFWTVICELIGTCVGFLLSVFGVLEPWIKNPFSDEARLSCACCAAPEIRLNLCAGAATQLIRGNAP